MELKPGMRLGRYEIIAPLGKGGMGEVYRAKDTQLDREVAVKVLAGSWSERADATQRFQREAKAVAALSHPNILDIHDYGVHQGILFAVSELLEGETLRGRLSRSALRHAEVLRISVEIAEGLAAAHSKGVIHRDLKPENIFITADSRIKILDFGLARLGPPEPSSTVEAATISVQTEPGAILGTMPYISPEQLRGKTADTRSDVFSFGCILYEMLSGRQPFRKDTQTETLGAILYEEPSPLREEVPTPLRQIASRCLQKDPVQRFVSAVELLGALKMVTTVTQKEQPPLPHTTRVQKHLWPAMVVILLAVVIAVLIWKQKSAGLRTAEKIESVAVLPLQNLSADGGQQYLVDGMTEELIAQLSRISALKVISRTSSMQYKEVKKPLREIARELDVDALVEGSVLREGNEVRVTVQLIHGTTDRNLWANSYQREMHGVLSLHSEVAQAIAREIRAKLTPQEERRFTGARSVNPAAHEAYLKAMYYRAQSKTLPEFQKAFELIQHAAKLDPQDALIQATLAHFYLDLGLWAVLPSSEAYTKAKEAALRAVRLDEDLAEGHQILGRVYHSYTWDQIAAQEEYQQAIELKPNDAAIRSDYAWYLCRTGQSDQAISEARKAQQLDPLSLLRRFWLGMVLHYSRHYEEALGVYKKVVELVPDDPQTRYQIARLSLVRRQYEVAISELKKANHLDPSDPIILPLLGVAYGLSGKKDEAEKMLQELKKKRDREYVRPYILAELHLAIGNKYEALDWLETAYKERDDWMAFLYVDPLMDRLRSEPRFGALLVRVGLPTANTRNSGH